MVAVGMVAVGSSMVVVGMVMVGIAMVVVGIDCVIIVLGGNVDGVSESGAMVGTLIVCVTGEFEVGVTVTASSEFVEPPGAFGADVTVD